VAPAEVIWEVTHACSAPCRSCPWAGRPRSPGELTTAEGCALIAQVAAWGGTRPTLVLSGGDPLERDDLLRLVERAAREGLRVVVEVAATPRLTPRAPAELRRAGCSLVRVGLDGPSASVHDRIRGVPGAFGQTLHACWAAREAGLPFRIATAVGPGNLRHLPALGRLVADLGAQGWDLFFPVPPRGRVRPLGLRPDQAEAVADWLPTLPVDAAVVEGPWDRLRALTVTPEGSICPGRFLPLAVGHALRDGLPAAWNGDAVRRLRETAPPGSRARAYGATGDPEAPDPLAAAGLRPRRPGGRSRRRPA
jgi:MoaA/NifB/PqqE/SkfB family radical SAM enzyme